MVCKSILCATLPSFLTLEGRPVLQIPKGEARSAAIHRIARFIVVSLPPSSEGLRAEVTLNVILIPHQCWHTAVSWTSRFRSLRLSCTTKLTDRMPSTAALFGAVHFGPVDISVHVQSVELHAAEESSLVFVLCRH